MTDPSDLQIDVREELRRIIVKMPSTAYEITFGLVPHGLCSLSGFGQDDPKAPITSHEFTLMARAAATERARELGWPAAGTARQRAWANRQPSKRWAK
jgi:hypothetical protein